jgi:hypothetical protein
MIVSALFINEAVPPEVRENSRRVIERMRPMVEAYGSTATLDASRRVIRRRPKAPAFALWADLMLADGRLDAAEQRPRLSFRGERRTPAQVKIRRVLVHDGAQCRQCEDAYAFP